MDRRAFGVRRGRGTRSGTRIRPGRLSLLVLRLAAIWIGVVFVGGLALFVDGVRHLVTGNPGKGAAMLAPGAVIIVVTWWVRDIRTVFRRSASGLTVVVDSRGITMLRSGEVVGTVDRSSVGLVEVRAVHPPTVDCLVVWGADRRKVGEWPTHWTKGPRRTVRVLRRHGYPWVVNGTGSVVAEASARSTLCPAWTDEVLAG